MKEFHVSPHRRDSGPAAARPDDVAMCIVLDFKNTYNLQGGGENSTNHVEYPVLSKVLVPTYGSQIRLPIPT